jgi:hypothetical protein
MPQSTRKHTASLSIRKQEPVTSPAAPKKLIFMMSSLCLPGAEGFDFGQYSRRIKS